MHIRADKQNQLRLRAEMTEQDKEAIRAAGRNEDTLPARILKEKMKREHLYAGVMEMTREIVQCECELFQLLVRTKTRKDPRTFLIGVSCTTPLEWAAIDMCASDNQSPAQSYSISVYYW